MLDGWELYEARQEMEGDQSQCLPTDAPRWDGAVDLAGKRILLWHEQGFGDLILMLRFVPRLAQMGAIVVLEVPMSAYVCVHENGASPTMASKRTVYVASGAPPQPASASAMVATSRSLTRRGYP